jgi:sugar lactone lactonase YvrE
MITTERLLSPSLPRGALFEGPYFNSADGHLWWVDIPNSLVLRAPADGIVEQFAGPERMSAVFGTDGDVADWRTVIMDFEPKHDCLRTFA